jgi:hypothetical protein
MSNQRYTPEFKDEAVIRRLAKLRQKETRRSGFLMLD